MVGELLRQFTEVYPSESVIKLIIVAVLFCIGNCKVMGDFVVNLTFCLLLLRVHKIVQRFKGEMHPSSMEDKSCGLCHQGDVICP